MPDTAETTTVSVALASETVTVGVLSPVTPSVDIDPVSEDVMKETGLVTVGAVVSTVMVNDSEEATIRPAINCRARYVHVPSANADGIHVSVTFCGTKLHTTVVKPERVNVTVVSTCGTKSPTTTLGVESDNGSELTTTGIPAVISRTVISPLDVVDELGR